MRIWKRGSVYWYEFVWRGKRIQRTTRARDLETARNVASAHRIALANGDAGIFEPAVMTLAQFGDKRFLPHVAATATSKETLTFYERRWAALMGDRALASAPLHRVDEAAISAFVSARRRARARGGRPLSVATVNRDLATLRKALRLAHEWRLIARVPRIRLLRGEGARDYVLGRTLQAAYLAVCAQPLAAVAGLILETGLRAREAATLRWQQVRLDAVGGGRSGFLTVTGKGGKKRTVPLTAAATRLLRALSDAGQYVFGGSVAVSVSTLDHQHARARAKAGLPREFVIHSLRHTCLTRLGEAGVDAFSIMRIAGHSSIAISQRYVHPSPAAIENAMLRLDDAEVPTAGPSGRAKAAVSVGN